jgi:hypothetical protein
MKTRIYIDRSNDNLAVVARFGTLISELETTFRDHIEAIYSIDVNVSFVANCILFETEDYGKVLIDALEEFGFN